MVSNTRPAPVDKFLLSSLAFSKLAEITCANGTVIWARKLEDKKKPGIIKCYYTYAEYNTGEIQTRVWLNPEVHIPNVVKVEYKENITLRLTMTKMLTPDPSEEAKFVVIMPPQ